MKRVLLIALVCLELSFPAPRIDAYFDGVACESVHVATSNHSTSLDAVRRIKEWKVNRIKRAIQFFGTKSEIADRFAPVIHKVAESYNLDPYVLVALIQHESSFRENIRGKAGEIGPTQIMPFWAHEFGFPVRELFSLERNIDTCGKILRKHLDRTGDIGMALRAYNSQSHAGTIYARRVKKKYETVIAYL